MFYWKIIIKTASYFNAGIFRLFTKLFKSSRVRKPFSKQVIFLRGAICYVDLSKIVSCELNVAVITLPFFILKSMYIKDEQDICAYDISGNLT